MVGEIDSLFPFLRKLFCEEFCNTYVGGVTLVLGMEDHGQKHYLNMGHLGSKPQDLFMTSNFLISAYYNTQWPSLL
jgi:hypothetical protein